MSSKSTTGVNVGGSSILVIFILLCLTTFATLSMVSANADLRLTEKAVQATTEYYAADSAAEEQLQLIDKVLQLNPGMEPAALSGAVPGVEVEGAPGNASYTVRYAVPVNDRQELRVALDVYATPTPGGQRYERTAWQVVGVGDWQPEQGGLDLWSGEGDITISGGLPPLTDAP